jgi:hypothetical protein
MILPEPESATLVGLGVAVLLGASFVVQKRVGSRNTGALS